MTAESENCSRSGPPPRPPARLLLDADAQARLLAKAAEIERIGCNPDGIPWEIVKAELNLQSLAKLGQARYDGSMTVQVNVGEAKNQLSKLLERAEAGEEIVIARAGRPIVTLVPCQRRPARRTPGRRRGQIHMAPDFDETPQDLIDAFEQGPIFPDEDAE